MNQDVQYSDPVEGARDVIERQLERQDRGEAESLEPVTRRGKEERERNRRKPH